MSINLPTDIADLRLWLDATRITPVADGVALTGWDDASGNGYHLSQGTSGKRPLYKENILNGQPIVRFDGSNDDLRRTGMLLSNLFAAAGATIYLVMKHTATDNDGAAFAHSGTYLDNWVQAHLPYQGDLYFDHGDYVERIAVTAPADFTGNFHVVELWRAGVNAELSVNGLLLGTNAAMIDLDITESGTFYLGSQTGAGFFHKGDYAEFLIYRRGLTTQERADVREYLGMKWGFIEAPTVLTVFDTAVGIDA